MTDETVLGPRAPGRQSDNFVRRILDSYFYLFLSLVLAAVVIYGFSQTANEKFIHPAITRPFVLYLHAVIFSAWVLLLIVQSALVSTGRVDLHKRIGWIGVGLGVGVILIGVQTAITMGRFNLTHFQPRFPEGALLISFFDICAFAIPFALAIYWRQKPEFHRRLQWIATCALTAAAFGRFPRIFAITSQQSPATRACLIWIGLYAGVDLLIFFAMMRDLAVDRRIHPVYSCGLTAFVVGQATMLFILVHHSIWWLRTARFFLA